MKAREHHRGAPEDRLTVLPHELAFLLQVQRRKVLAWLNSGELPNASRTAHKRVAVEDALELIRRRTSAGECSPLAELLLEEMRIGQLRVAPQEAKWLTLEAALSRCELVGGHR